MYHLLRVLQQDSEERELRNLMEEMSDNDKYIIYYQFIMGNIIVIFDITCVYYDSDMGQALECLCLKAL